MVQGLPELPKDKEICEGRAFGKHHRDSFEIGKSWRARQPFENIYTNMCGPIQTAIVTGNRYFLTFISDHSRMCWVYFMRYRYEVFNILRRSR